MVVRSVYLDNNGYAGGMQESVPISRRQIGPEKEKMTAPEGAVIFQRGGAARWAAEPKKKGLPVGSPFFLAQKEGFEPSHGLTRLLP